MIKSLKNKIRHKIFSDYRGLFEADNIDSPKLKEVVTRVTNEMISREGIECSAQDRDNVITDLVNEFTGFGEIEAFLKDPTITEIMVNGTRKVYIERGGKKILSGVSFDDEAHVMRLIYKILSPTRRRVDESSPFTDVSLPDGSRVNIIIPPLALDGPTVTIRKFLKNITTPDDLIAQGTLDKRMSEFMIASIKAKINIIFSGATGAGKTTTLNVYSSYISDDERIVTIEDTAELHLSQDNVVRLEVKQANIEGKGEISIRELFKNSLRMRPDRIVLGEIRGPEALDMLQAACSGHRGSLVVIHGNSPQDVLYRIETMALTSGLPISLDVIQRQIANTVQLIVHQEQLGDGSRKVTHIAQISGIKNGQAVVEDIFTYNFESLNPDGTISGKWIATGAKPVFYDLYARAGVVLPESLFDKG